MTLEELQAYYKNNGDTQLFAAKLKEQGIKVHFNGLIGSSATMIANAIFDLQMGTHLFLLTDKEEAAYFQNDLESLADKKTKILFFPSAYRRPYQVEETDNSNVVLRAEVLNEVSRRTQRTIIVSYAEALHEKVVTKTTWLRTRSTSKREKVTASILSMSCSCQKNSNIQFCNYTVIVKY